MIRFLILSGYFELMMYLQITGKLDQYINAHYNYLIYLSMILSLILAIVQLYLWVKNNNQSSHLTTKFQRATALLIMSIPLLIGLFFPTVSLDAAIVDAKGFNFPLSKESTGDDQVKTQYLQPDTSFYFTKSDYSDMMEKVKKKYLNNDVISVTSENYMEVMEAIYDFPNEFSGKQIEMSGFVYLDPTDQTHNIFLFRFGIIHCIADSGVFGLLTQFEEAKDFKNNQWINVKGTIQSDYYKPFNRNLPSIKVETVKAISTPKNQYVYRAF
ncbi:MAG: TIGR03943 family protein [Streptococcaceae bacterium]|jgi:putative membrane protein|nr:TIGR03943 family protein [Streptococcaceae bacterium]MCH4178059.1 TIGR03943 family protein [Streptococcaceae bacterium]